MKKTTAERLKEYMEIKNVTQSQMMREIQPVAAIFGVNYNKSSLSQHISGKYEPGNTKLAILGIALGVSELWLMGYDVPMERDKSEEDKQIKQMEFMMLFSSLTDEQQNMIIAQIKGLLEHGNK